MWKKKCIIIILRLYTGKNLVNNSNKSNRNTSWLKKKEKRRRKKIWDVAKAEMAQPSEWQKALMVTKWKWLNIVPNVKILKSSVVLLITIIMVLLFLNFFEFSFHKFYLNLTLLTFLSNCTYNMKSLEGKSSD